MRNRVMIVTAALVLASASLATAQTAPQDPAAKAAAAPSNGRFDFGFRGSSIDGDEARYQRYRDLRDGANVNLFYAQERDSFGFTVAAQNIGYRDGRYVADFENRRVKLNVFFDQLPLNYAYYSLTPWQMSVSNGSAVGTLDAETRMAVQSKTPGIVGIPNNATTLAIPSVYRSLAQPFELQARRDSFGTNAVVSLVKDVDLTLALTSYARSGSMPWGGAFAFNNGNEMALPLDNRATDLSTGVEWANKKGMFKVGYDLSYFNNAIQTLVWDNPLRATDWNSSPNTGYDPSGYSNGNGPARGLMSLAPSNHLNSFNTMAMIKLPRRTTLNGTIVVTDMKQDEAIPQFTLNSVVQPLMPGLPRQTAQAHVRYTNAAMNFTTRPNRFFGLQARLRYTDRDERTPTWHVSEERDGVFDNVRFDAVPEDVGGSTHHLNIARMQLDVNASFHVAPYTQLRLGYGRDESDREGRSFGNLKDDTFRVSVDTVGNQFVSLRGIFEHTKRVGSDFDEHYLEHGGAQPALRFYDEADRNRNRGTLVVELNPISVVGFNVSVAAGQDKYEGPDHEFGLLDNNNTAVTLGFDVVPREQVAFGVQLGREKFSSLQKSRNANPDPDPTWTAADRDWTLDNDETVNNLNVYFDLLRVLPKTDIRFGYDFSDSDQAFIHGGPRIASLTAAKQFLPLPNVTNTWNRATVDVKYFFRPRIGIGLGYWYEKFEVEDFATVNLSGTEDPRIDYLGGLVTGYGNRPYKANTLFARMIYLF